MEEQKRNEEVVPLCVDLDGTLVFTDTLYEQLCLLIRYKPLMALKVPLWLSKGKAYLKSKLAELTELNVSFLPYNAELIDFLRKEKEAGRKIVLATASHKKIADAVADELKLFDEVFSTTEEFNLRGENKLKTLQAHFPNGFDYVGNDESDIPICKAASGCYFVSNDENLKEEVKELGNLKRFFSAPSFKFSVLCRLLRVYQWVKNGLIFVPLVGAHRFLDVTALVQSFVAFVLFSLCCSGVYIINDLMDLENDRRHREKRRRPFASGRAPLKVGLLLFPLLMVVSIVGAACLSGAFLATLIGYIVITTLYSWYLKQRVVIDILILAGLYTLRIFAGSCATGITITPWLLAFSMFFFLSLACVKRYAELWAKGSSEKLSGRGYLAVDQQIVAQFGIASGFIAVLVLALYIHGNEQQALYARPEALWFLCPVILFWIMRVWLLAERGEMAQDPIVFALRDKTSYVVLFLAACVFMVALVTI